MTACACSSNQRAWNDSIAYDQLLVCPHLKSARVRAKSIATPLMWIALNITVHHVAGMLILWGTLLFYSLQLEHYRSEELATRSWSCFSLVGQTFVNVWPVRLVLFVRVALQRHLYSLVSRPSTPPVFDHLQYAKTYASSFWGVEGLGTRLLLHLADQSSTHGHFLSGDFFYGAHNWSSC